LSNIVAFLFKKAEPWGSGNLPAEADLLHDRSRQHRTAPIVKQRMSFGGADRDRTGDPLLAKQVLSQLSYSPRKLSAISHELSADFQLLRAES
jgi:hypothetical protein